MVIGYTLPFVDEIKDFSTPCALPKSLFILCSRTDVDYGLITHPSTVQI